MRVSTKCILSMLLVTGVVFSSGSMVSASRLQPHEMIRASQEKSDQNPDEARRFYNKGESYEQSSRWQDAVNAYQRAVEIKPDFAYAYYNLGWCYVAWAKFQDALKAHQQALLHVDVRSFGLKLRPAQVHYAIGCDYFNLNRFDEALASQQRALESDSGNKE